MERVELKALKVFSRKNFFRLFSFKFLGVLHIKEIVLNVLRLSLRFPPYGRKIQSQLLKGLDLIRNESIALAINRIKCEKIQGAFAEVGVFRGDLSKIIHLLAPDRVLYLFDTFEGFPKQSMAPHDPRYDATSPEIVFQTIGDRTNIVIRKGLVPETYRGLENEQFAFVMIDLDLYEPTAASLAFFYPRMKKGGYIFVHDYYNPEWKGVAKAVDAFVKKTESIQIIDLPDAMGSIVFRKV
ncbi:MAG: TylF/MycF/NovP-related O-methyltransferase [Candidatus Sigynarchaeota archaeon]